MKSPVRNSTIISYAYFNIPLLRLGFLTAARTSDEAQVCMSSHVPLPDRRADTRSARRTPKKKSRTPREVAPAAVEDDTCEEFPGADFPVDEADVQGREMDGVVLSHSSEDQELGNLDAGPLAT